MVDKANDKSIAGFWRALASMRLGLVIMFLLAGASTLGVVLPRGLEDKSQLLVTVNSVLGLDRVFTTWWFKALAYLLTVNVAICFFNRIQAVVHVIRNPRTTMGALDRLKSYESFSSREKPEDVVERIDRVLLTNRYRVLQSQDEEQIYFYGDKQRIALLGPMLAHFGLLVMVAGIIWSNLSGFERTIVLGSGQTTQITLSTSGLGRISQDFTVRLADVKQVSPAAGQMDIQGSVSLVDTAGTVLKSGKISYNSPFWYGDLKVSMLRYVPTVIIKTSDNNKQTLISVSAAENNTLKVPRSDLLITFSDIRPNKTSPTVRFTIFKSGDPTPIDQRVIGVGQPITLIQYPYFNFSLQNYQDSVQLRVSQNPAIGVSLSGALMLVLGMWISLIARYRKVWIVVSADSELVQVTAGGFSPKQKLAFATEFNELLEEIKGGG